MVKYRDWERDSGVIAYEIGIDFIIVEFRRGKHTIYTYTYRSAGQNNVERMKFLAQNGDGLNEFINENKVRYDSRR